MPGMYEELGVRLFLAAGGHPFQAERPAAKKYCYFVLITAFSVHISAIFSARKVIFSQKIRSV